MDELISYILNNNLTREKAIEYLRGVDLDNQRKNFIISYCYPRRILDYELPKHIMAYRKRQGKPMGWLVENPGETFILVEAYRGLQYRNFMRHLMHAFLTPEFLSSVSGVGEDKCPICGKTIYYTDSLSPEDKNQETLAIMSKESSVCLCKDCLVQLLGCYNLISEVEGSDFLTRYEKHV